MLKRILTAIILIPLFVSLLMLLPPKAFCLLTSLVVFFAAWEWSAFMGVKKVIPSFIFPILTLIALFISCLCASAVIVLSAFWWLYALILVIAYPKLTKAWSNSVIVRGVMGLMTLVPCWLVINVLRNIPGKDGIYMILFLFVLIWGADSGAYFAGRFFGKNKLAPTVSPGKTREGLYGALLTTIVITLIALYLTDSPFRSWFAACVVAIITVLFSIVGDLFESMLKRNVGLKDSGRLLPGHGGILDRIDSLTAAAPIFFIGLGIWQKMYS